MAGAVSKVETVKNKGGRPKGYPKSGGRVAGIPNKVTLQKAAEIAAQGLTPLDFMLKVLRDEQREDAERFEAAKAAAPYCHPRLQAVDANMTGDMSFTIIVNKPA